MTVNLVHPGTTRTERTDEATARGAAGNAVRRIADAQAVAQGQLIPVVLQ